MGEHMLDLSVWPRADQFHLFRSYEKPHFAVTARMDISHLMARRGEIASPYRACLYAIGAGIHADAALLTRFRPDCVLRHDSVALSMTVPKDTGGFGYAYVPWQPDPAGFDRVCAAAIATARTAPMSPNTGARDDLAYASCMPWLDYTSINNALPGPDDCIPRISWGKFCDHGDRWDMAMTIEVHHALVDGAAVGVYFAAVQDALNAL